MSAARLLETAALFIAYFATAYVGLHFDPVSGFATLVWPPTGIALAALVLRGRYLWPGIALGALAVNLVTGAPLAAACGIAAGNTIEALLGAFLLQRIGFEPSLERVRDVLGLVVLGAALSTTVSAAVGVASLWAVDKTPDSALDTWRAWWLGDAIGDVVVAPALLVLGPRSRLSLRPSRIVELVALLASVILVSVAVLGHPPSGPTRSIAYLVFPLLIWAALRFGPPGGTGATLLVTAIAVGATVAGKGPFASSRISDGLLYTQLFIAVVAVTVLVLSAAIAEGARALADRDAASAELGARNAELARSNRELEDFATVASHDLQEPLRKVQFFIDRLGTKLGGSLDEEAQGHLDRVLNASDRVQRLIDDLFAFARVKTRAEPFVAVDLGAVARAVAQDLEARIQDANGKVELGALPTIEADPVQMRQLLQNLLANALKFHRKDVPPVVTVRSEPGEGDTCRLLVTDNGIGFEEKYLDRIFTIFHRLHGRDEYEGTGVGLAICRRIVERHGGTITATSRPMQGSTFIVTMPRAHNAARKP